MFLKKCSTIFLVFTLLFIGNNVFGASPFDNFDSYNDGSLTAQSDWVLDGGVNNFQVQATTTQGGSAKAVKIPQTACCPVVIKTIGLANGSIIGWLQDATSSSTSSIGLYIYDETRSTIGELWFNSTGDIDFWGNTGETILTGYSPDTWYEVEIEWRNSDSKVRARANSGAWSSWLDPQQAWTTMGYIALIGGGGEGYFDSLTYDPSHITISADFASSTLAYAGQLFTDLSVPIIMIVGLPMGFWVIRKIISLVGAR